MTSSNDADRLIRMYLDEGLVRLPDRSYDAVRSEIELTQQRAVFGPWRERHMSNVARFAAAAAAVVAVAIVGALLFSGRDGPSVGAPTASPSVERSTSSSPSAPPKGYTWAHPLEPGTYATQFAWSAPVLFTFTVPPGWDSRDVEILKGDRMALQFYPVENVYSDPCGGVLADPPVGATVDDLSAALTAIPTVEWTAPRPASLGGFNGTYIEMTVPASLPCPASEFHVLRFEQAVCGRGCGGLGGQEKLLEWEVTQLEGERMWLLDVDGYRYVVDAAVAPSASDADRAELQSIIDSLSIETYTPTPPPQPAGS